MDKTIYNPFTKSNVNLGKSPTYECTNAFFEELKKKRKFAIRLGQLAVQQANYNLSQKAFKKLCNGTLNFSDLSESDIILNIDQKGVDMKIGLVTSSEFSWLTFFATRVLSLILKYTRIPCP